MTDAATPDEAHRVRACLECGELVPYEQRSCPHCGHHEPLLPTPVAADREACPECGEEVASRLVFCPHCGADRGPEPEPVGSEASLPSQASTASVDLAALVLALLGPLLMAGAVLLAFAYA